MGTAHTHPQLASFPQATAPLHGTGVPELMNTRIETLIQDGIRSTQANYFSTVFDPDLQLTNQKIIFSSSDKKQAGTINNPVS